MVNFTANCLLGTITSLQLKHETVDFPQRIYRIFPTITAKDGENICNFPNAYDFFKMGLPI